VLSSLSPASLAWVHRVAVLVHVSGVVIWMGAVAYHLFVLTPAMRAAELDRPARYALMRAVKRRIRIVVGVAVVAIVVSGVVNAQLRGLWGGGPPAPAAAQRIFHVKLGVAAVLIGIFLTALPLLKRVRQPRLRGRLFTAVHVVVLTLGAIAVGIGVYLAG
jgi:uncharacterized membrane protein